MIDLSSARCSANREAKRKEILPGPGRTKKNENESFVVATKEAFGTKGEGRAVIDGHIVSSGSGSVPNRWTLK